MNLHNKNSSTLSLYSLRGKSWSYVQKHITNLLDNDNDGNIGSPTTNNALYEHRADVQRLDIKDYELYGISPSDPGPMVLCNQCSHIMAPEGIVRHVKRVHGTKIVPAASSKSRIAMLLASRANSTAGSVFASSNSNASITNNSLSNSCSTSSLTTAFSNRLNLSKMAPPGKSLNNDECKSQPTNSATSSMNSMPAVSSNSVHSSVISTASASTLSSSSNSNSPTSSLKTATSGSSSNGGRRNRKILPIKYREYDPEKHCGVIVGNMKPCTRSLTCKTHQISLRRNVDGRSKPFDQLLAEHRNNVKDGVPKSSSGRQLNSLDSNSNQLALDSIADSNSSSSFDLERRSFSSNSNQSSYNNEHVYPPQPSSNQSMSGLTLLSSSALTPTVAATPSVTLNPAMSQSRKPLQPAFSIDDAAMNNTAIEAMDSVNSSASIMQIQSSNNSNVTASNLNNLSDYSVQINQLNDLIDDDNGDCLDMSFWESFDNNFTYENDLLATNSTQTQPQQQQQPQPQLQSYDAKAGVKRSMNQIYEASLQDSSLDRKRKRGNVSPAIKSNIRERLKSSPNSQERAISMIAAEIAHSSASFDAKSTPTATIPNGGIFRDQMAATHSSGSANAQQRSDDKRDATTLKKRGIVNVKKNESIVTPHEKKPTSSTSPDSGRLMGHTEDMHILHSVHANDLHATPVANSRLNVKPQEEMAPMKTHEIDDGDEDDSFIQLTAEAPQPLQTMILSSSDDIVRSTDLKTITKILSENDHRPTPTQTHEAAGDSKSQTINAVPIDENENYLLDIVYKCLRGKGDRTTNSNYANGATVNGNSNSTSSVSISSSHRNAGTGSRISSAIGVDKEKENALEQQSDDECVPTFPTSATSTSIAGGTGGGSSNSLLIPAAQRYSTKIHHVGLPRPIDTNRFGMARGRGISQFKHAIDSTKKTQQQIFHRLQSQQPNGTTYSGSFSSASMIALRNNGSLMRFNSTNLMSSGVGGNVSSASANNGIALGTAKTANTATASDQNAMAKGATKKASSTNATGSGVVVVSADASSSTASSGAGGASNAPMAGNQTHYAILRRQPTAKHQSMQILSTRAATCEPTNFSVMPVIHRVRARTMTPHVPKNVQAQTDALLQSLPKSLRAKMLASTLLAMAAKKPATANSSSSSSSLSASASLSATQSNAIPVDASVSNANSSSSPSPHSTVKSSSGTVRPPSKLSQTFSHKSSLSTSASSPAALKNVKQNGHYSVTGSSAVSSGGGSGGGVGISDSIYTVNSLSRNLSNSGGSSASGASPSYHRSGSNHRSSASLLQMQNSPSIDSLILPKIIS